MTRDNVEEFFNNMLDELLELLYDIKCWAKATKKCCRVLICGGLIGQVSETVNS